MVPSSPGALLLIDPGCHRRPTRGSADEGDPWQDQDPADSARTTPLGIRTRRCGPSRAGLSPTPEPGRVSRQRRRQRPSATWGMRRTPQTLDQCRRWRPILHQCPPAFSNCPPAVIRPTVGRYGEAPRHEPADPHLRCLDVAAGQCKPALFTRQGHTLPYRDRLPGNGLADGQPP